VDIVLDHNSIIAYGKYVVPVNEIDDIIIQEGGSVDFYTPSYYVKAKTLCGKSIELADVGRSDAEFIVKRIEKHLLS
jgi:hypothetical protein